MCVCGGGGGGGGVRGRESGSKKIFVNFSSALLAQMVVNVSVIHKNSLENSLTS